MGIDGIRGPGGLGPGQGPDRVEGAAEAGRAGEAAPVNGPAGAEAASGVTGAAAAAVLNRLRQVVGAARAAGKSEEQVIDDVVADALEPYRRRRDFPQVRDAVTDFVLHDPVWRAELTRLLRAADARP